MKERTALRFRAGITLPAVLILGVLCAIFTALRMSFQWGERLCYKALDQIEVWTFKPKNRLGL